MGLLLIFLAVVGIFTSNRLVGQTSEDVHASRYAVTKGFLIMIFYMITNVVMFVTFLFAAVWFIFFNQ